MNVQLVDTTTGEQVWAERYDRPFTEIFALQDDLVQNLATTLKLQLSVWTNGFAFRKTTKNVDAYDYDLRGLKQYLGLTKSDNLQARQFFETALTLDPQYAQAYAHIGFTYYIEWVMKWSPDPQTLEQALAYGQKAVALNDFYGWGIRSWRSAMYKKRKLTVPSVRSSGSLLCNPILPIASISQAEVLMFAGRPGEALQSIQHAIRLNPHGHVYRFLPIRLGLSIYGAVCRVDCRVQASACPESLLSLAYPLQAFNYLGQWMAQQSHDPKILDQAYDAAQNGSHAQCCLPLLIPPWALCICGRSTMTTPLLHLSGRWRLMRTLSVAR